MKKNLNTLLVIIVTFYTSIQSGVAYSLFKTKNYELGFVLLQNPFRFSAYYADFESDMCYLKARYYSPKYMRFISRDTYDLSNRYAYGDGNPITNIDPAGHMSLGAWLGLGAGAIIAAAMGAVYPAVNSLTASILIGACSGGGGQLIQDAADGNAVSGLNVAWSMGLGGITSGIAWTMGAGSRKLLEKDCDICMRKAWRWNKTNQIICQNRVCYDEHFICGPCGENILQMPPPANNRCPFCNGNIGNVANIQDVQNQPVQFLQNFPAPVNDNPTWVTHMEDPLNLQHVNQRLDFYFEQYPLAHPVNPSPSMMFRRVGEVGGVAIERSFNEAVYNVIVGGPGMNDASISVLSSINPQEIRNEIMQRLFGH